jgi:serine protease
VVALIEEEYSIEAVSMTSHTVMTFSAYLSPEITLEVSANVYVTEVVSVTEEDFGFSGPDATTVAVPAVPKAYEPFALEIATRREDAGTLIAVNVAGNVITIEHQTDHAAEFIPPGGMMVVNFPGLPAGDYTVQNKEFASGGFDSGGYLYPDLPTTINIAEAPPTQQVYALYLPEIKHYFITASEVEKEGIKNYTIPVDAGFNAWSANGPAPESALPVCRFYSYLVNSHFYTASEAECEMLKNDDSGWVYEGIAFQALVPAAGGACPPGTDPVWRLYNNRYAQQDSNHRFITSLGIYHAMVAEGWIGEGVAFCSPPSSE